MISATEKAPFIMHSNQGRNFDSAMMKSFFRLFEIVKTRTTPYRPSSNGQVERYNTMMLLFYCGVFWGASSETGTSTFLSLAWIFEQWWTEVQDPHPTCCNKDTRSTCRWMSCLGCPGSRICVSLHLCIWNPCYSSSGECMLKHVPTSRVHSVDRKKMYDVTSKV